MGFLYSPSCVAGYKLTGSEDGKKAATKAADQLLTRYHPVGEFLQAWGPMDQPENYRLIIDCLNNLPLLFWASDVTGDSKYREIADKHIHTAVSNVICDDYSTWHTFFSVGRKYSAEKLEKYLDLTESFYIGDGWYRDGDSNQKYYYISFAIHFYCLIYAKHMEKEDARRSELFKERAMIFARSSSTGLTAPAKRFLSGGRLHTDFHRFHSSALVLLRELNRSPSDR